MPLFGVCDRDFLTVFLMGTPGQREEETARNQALMLEAMKQEAQNGREIIQKFCELNLERIQNSGKTRELPAQIKKLEGALSELYDLVSTH